MENFYFFYVQNNEQKIMQMRLPIGTQCTVEHWSAIFKGFGADLKAVTCWNDVMRRFSEHA